MSTTIRETETPRVIPVEVEEAVRRGAELLDERHPGWADKIDTETLSFPSTEFCVLGQLYGSYGTGLVALDVYGGIYGVYIAGKPLSNATLEAYESLTPAWLAEIMERRSA